MKTQKILAILCCTLLAVSLTGCFPFNMIKDIMQDNTNGGADGPTTIVVGSEEPESFSDDFSEEPSETNSEYEFNLEDFSDMATSEDTEIGSEPDYTDLSYDLADATAWYDLDDENAMWLFTQTQAVLYEDAENYYIASYSRYYDEDAVEYVSTELSEYGLTKEEQIDAMEDLGEGERYFCLVFSDINVYEDNVYMGEYEEDIIPYVGFEYQDDDTVYHDLIQMDTMDMVYFFSYPDTDSDTGYDDSSVSEDCQRIGSVETGYVDVPADYVKFTDSSLTDEYVQYSDVTGTNIVTMTYYDDSISAKTYAGVMLAAFEEDPEIDPSSVTGATVTLDGCEAFQVYGYYPEEDLFLVVWLLDSPEDDYIHYVAVEFTSDNYDLFEMVENTYHVAY